MARRVTPRSAQQWGAVVPQWLGIFGLVACFVFWAVTQVVTGAGVVEPAFLTAFGGLIAIGQGAEAVVALKGPAPLAPLPPSPPRAPAPDDGIVDGASESP